MTQPDTELLGRATALRDVLRRAVADARIRLIELEEENRRLHEELRLMEGSSGRKLLLSLRSRLDRTAEWLRHPLWSGGTLARAALNRQRPRQVRRLVRHLTRRSAVLRLAPVIARTTDNPDEQSAIRWIGPITIRHETREALLCHPNSSVEFRASVVPGSWFETGCGVAPQAWTERPAPVDFRVEVRSERGDWISSAELRLDVVRRVHDRRWVPIRLRLPADAGAGGEQAIVTLTAAVPPGEPVEHVWALFGEPAFTWNRSAAEVRRSIGAFAAHARARGFRSALTLAHGAAVVERELDLYAAWLERHAVTAEALSELAREASSLAWQPLISVVTPVFNTDPGLLRACIESVRRQVYPSWELCLADDASTDPGTAAVLREYGNDSRIRITRLPQNSGVSAATNAALDVARGEFIALLDHDDELAPDALFRMAQHLNAHPDADLIYSDEDKLDPAGRRCDPNFKPDWSPDLFLSYMYTCHLMVVRRSVIERVGRFREGFEGAQDYDLVLRIMEVSDRIHHVPRILYHWRKLPESTASAQAAKPWAADAGRRALEDHIRRCGMTAEVLPGPAPGLFRVRRQIRGEPLVSLIIPTAGRLRRIGSEDVDLLAAAVDSVTRKTSYRNFELIVVADEAGIQPAARRALDGTRHRIVRLDAAGPFNFSRKVNHGVAHAAGQHILLFNDDLEVAGAEWLAAMLEYSQDPAVGAVGSKLLYPDGRLQHVGIVLGVNGVAAHAFHQHPGSSTGYFGSAICPRNYSAVTAACLMTRREVFEQVGGFDEAFPVDFNDVDYCLRVRRAGYRVVFTPYAQLIHHESASFGSRLQDPEGLREMKRRWADVIENDPCYNPNLTREYPDFRIAL